jgi:hypothetical protein
MHQHHAGWTPWVGDLPTRKGGAMISDRDGVTTGYALDNLQQRGELFVGPGEKVYEGMVVGENARADEMHVNAVREKQKTNIRTHSADEAIKLVPPRDVTLETAIEFIADDELVEVTPTSLRLRKRILKEHAARRGDPTGGGSTRQPIMTAYRQRALTCATSLSTGPMRPRDLKPIATDAYQILRRNVYGWFERVEHGLYGISPAGRKALETWADFVIEASAPDSPLQKQVAAAE